MKRIFTLTTALKFVVLLGLWSCLGLRASAQVPAACNATGYDYEMQYLGLGYLAPVNITIGTVTPQYNFSNPITGAYTYGSSTYPTQDLTGSVSFVVTAGTSAPVATTLGYETFLGMYVDWDKDGYFTSPGEYITTARFNTGTNCCAYAYNYTGSINVPGYIPSGNYRCRIMFGEYYSATDLGLPGAGNSCANWASSPLSSNYPYSYCGSLDVTLVVTNTASCYPPVNPSTGAITSSSAVINWNAPNNINNGYQYVIVPGGSPVTATPLVNGFINGTSVSATGLSPNTSYSVYIRSGCSATDSSIWAGPLTFTTLAPQCTTAPNTPAINNAPLTTGICAGNSISINATNVNSTVSGVQYQWQQSTNGTSWNSGVTGGSGATTLSYTTPAFPVGATPLYYRITAKCVNGANTYSAAPSSSYAVSVSSYSVPYFEDFTTTPDNAIPNCYEINIANPVHFSVQSTYTAADGTNIPAIRADYPSTYAPSQKNAFFTIPPLVLTGGTAYTVQFNYSRSNLTYRQRLQLYTNTTDPGTVDLAGSPFVTGGNKIFDTAYTFNNVALAKLTYTPPVTGTYYFTWYDSSTEASAPALGTQQGVSNVAIYISQPCVQPTTQPTGITFTSNVSSITGSFTPPSPAPDKYLVVRTLGNTPLTGFVPANATVYSLNQSVGNGGTIVYAGKYPTFTDNYLSSGVQYTYTIFAFNDLCTGGPLYDTTAPLVGTYQTSGGNTYVWNRTVAADYQVATNWTPNRIVKDPSDILVFNNTNADTVNNVPNQIIGQLNVINNTSVRMRANTLAATTLTLQSFGSNTNVLNINNNSSLILDGTTTALTLAFAGANTTANINGNLEVQNTSVANILNFYNCTATVGSTGSIAAGGSLGTQAILYTSAANLIMNGTYNHKYTTVLGGTIPLAQWNTGSTVLISGYTTLTGTITLGNFNNQNLYNFTYNCPNQTGAINFGGLTANTVVNIPGTFTVASTGTGNLALSTTTYYIYNVGNFVQSGGIFDLGTGTPTIYTQSFNVAGSFAQTGGTFRSTGTGQMLNFNGTNGTQSVSFFNSAPSGGIVYRISNYAGINLSGTGTLTTNFNINSGGGMRISTTSPNPLTTSLNVAYAGTGSTLTYDTSAIYTATSNVWPAVNGPYNVTIYVGLGNAVTMPFSRIIAGTLTFTSGDLDVNSNTLTIGTGTGATGAIAGTNGIGFVRLTSGYLTRWFPTSGLPANNASASTGTGIGYFPVSYGASNRNVYTYFSSATALSTGGTITVSHANAAGLTPVVIADGAYTVQKRTNASWTFTTGNALALAPGASIGIRVTSANLFNPIATNNLRLVKSGSVVGNYITGGGTIPNVYAERTGLAISDLVSGAWYVGAANADINSIWTAINTGPWSANNTWDQNVQPPTGAICVINPAVNVTLDVTSNVIKVLTNNGTLTVNANTLTVDSALYNNDTVNATGGTIIVNGNTTPANLPFGINNNGYFNVGGGVVTVGPSGGGNKPFNNNSMLNVSAGTLNINGNLLVNGYYTSGTTPNSTFIQSGGAINVDGNANGSAATSVASSLALVSLRSPNLTLTGGTLTIVDPHQNGTPNTFEYAVATTNAPFYNYNVPVANPATAHTLVFGNGTSTDAGGNTTYGFKINPAVSSGRINLGNVIVNGTNANNRFVGIGTTTAILGNLTVNNGGEFRGYNAGGAFTLMLKNNLTVNSGGIFTSYYLYLTDYSNFGSPYLPASQSQVISGAGSFRNNYILASSTANFYYLYLCGGSNPTIQDSVSFSGTIYFAGLSYPSTGTILQSHIYVPNVSNYRIAELSGASTTASATNGWVVGAYQKHANTGSLSLTFPIGDSLYYTPLNIGSAGGNVTTGGDLYARVTRGIEPNIASSTLNPLKTVKRYYTIGKSVGNPIAFTSGTLTARLPWVAADLPVGANTNAFYVGYDSAAANSWSYPLSTFKFTTQIQVNQLVPRLVGNYAVGENCPPSAITQQPVGAAICSGTPDTLSVTATGLGLTYQWYRNGTAVTGATKSQYIIANPQQVDSGAYYVIVNGLCSAPILSNTTNVTITSAPSITTQPVSSAVCVGGADSFSVVATGTAPLAYQWAKNGLNIGGATSTRYSIPATTIGSAGGYTVTISNVCGSATSNTAALVVNPLPVATVTAIGATTVCSGGTIVLQAPAGAANYVWTIDGAPSGFNSRYDTVSIGGGVQVKVTDNNGCTKTSAADSVKVISAPPATITTYSNTTFCLPGSVVLYADTASGYSYSWLKNGTSTGAVGPYYTALSSGNYQVIVKNQYNCPDTSSVQTVAANTPPVPVISASGPLTFCNGNSVTLSTTASFATYTWYNLNTNTVISTTSTSTGIFSSGSFEVFVTDANGCNGASSPVVVNVNPLPAVTATAQGPTNICPGGTVTMVGSAGTDLTVKYQWYKTGGGPGLINGATNASYTANNNGNYYIKITDTVTGCSATSSPNISVNINTPTATISPNGNQTVCQGTSVTLTANAGASYQWYLNGSTPLSSGQTLTTSTGGVYTVAVTNATGCTATSSGKTLTVVPNPVATATAVGATTFCAGGSVVLNADTGTGLVYTWTPGGSHAQSITANTSGAYSVSVTNTNGCTTVSNTVNVASVPYPVPTITSGGLPTSICVGQNVLLTAGPVGNTYLWSFNGTPLPYTDPNRTSISYPAATTGTYTVTVTNSTGCASTTATGVSVYVNPIPTIQTLGPTTFCWGSSDQLTVNAGTGAGLAYQWYRDSIAVNGSTGPSITIFDSGKYYVVVNVVGSCSQTSASTVIHVNQLPAPVISASGNTLTCSGSYTHYQWYMGNVAIAGDTTASISAFQAGDYHVVVTDGKGCNGSSNIYHKGNVGIGNVNKDDINIYPNPVNTVVHIDAPVAVDATISAIDGKILVQQADAKTIELSGLSNGIYMIRVYDKSGSLLKVEKLVKASN